MSQQDLYLIDQIKVRNKLSLQAFCDRHGGLIYSYLTSLLSDDSLSAGVFEKTMVDIWDKSSQYDKSTKTPLQWVFDLAFQNALVKKREEHADFNFKLNRPPKIDSEDQIKKEFPPKPLPGQIWHKIEGQLISVPRFETMSETKFPGSTIPPITAPTRDKTAAGMTSSLLPPKIQSNPTPSSPPQKDAPGTLTSAGTLNPMTSAPPPVVKVPGKSQPASAGTPPPIPDKPGKIEQTKEIAPKKEEPKIEPQKTGISVISSTQSTEKTEIKHPGAPTKSISPSLTQKTAEPVKEPVKIYKDQKSPVATSKPVESTSSVAPVTQKPKDTDKSATDNKTLDHILKTKTKPAKASGDAINWWAVKTFVAWGFTIIFGAGFLWSYNKWQTQSNEVRHLRTEQVAVEAKMRSMEEQLQSARTQAAGAIEQERTFQTRLQLFQQNIDQHETDNAALKDELKSKEARISFLEGNLGRVVFLASTSTEAAAFGRCIWDDSARSGVIYARNLPKLKDDRVWQVWASIGDRDVSAGYLNVSQDGSGSATLDIESDTGTPDEFFVTDEPLGGSSRPTGQAVISGT